MSTFPKEMVVVVNEAISGEAKLCGQAQRVLSLTTGKALGCMSFKR